jgi:hypothetical protein
MDSKRTFPDIGRRSGLQSETVIEVIGHDQHRDIYYVASGGGPNQTGFKAFKRAHRSAFVSAGAGSMPERRSSCWKQLQIVSSPSFQAEADGNHHPFF